MYSLFTALALLLFVWGCLGRNCCYSSYFFLLFFKCSEDLVGLWVVFRVWPKQHRIFCQIKYRNRILFWVFFVSFIAAILLPLPPTIGSAYSYCDSRLHLYLHLYCWCRRCCCKSATLSTILISCRMQLKRQFSIFCFNQRAGIHLVIVQLQR